MSAKHKMCTVLLTSERKVTFIGLPVRDGVVSNKNIKLCLAPSVQKNTRRHR